MAWSVAIPLIVAAAQAGAQWLNGEQARKASKEERKRIEEALAKLSSPDFDVSWLTPEEYQVAATYVPEIATFYEEAAPELVEAASPGAVAGRDAQMRALERLRNLSESGDDVQSQILRDRALREAATQNAGAQESIKDSFARRGMAGSGLEFVSAMMAEQGAAQRAALGGEQAALDAYNRKLDAMRESAILGGQIRQEDIDLERLNTERINDYNRRFAKDRQDYSRYVADTRNDAQVRNNERTQRVSDLNVGQANDYADRYQDNRNKYAQTTFENERDIGALRSGQYRENARSALEEGRDRANAISGVGSMINTGYSAYNESEEREKDRRAGVRTGGGGYGR